MNFSYSVSRSVTKLVEQPSYTESDPNIIQLITGSPIETLYNYQNIIKLIPGIPIETLYNYQNIIQLIPGIPIETAVRRILEG